MLSSALRRLHEQDHVYLAGNATTALYLTLRALDLSGKHVGFAANVCTSVPMAVSFSGNEPVFLDIDAATMTLSVESLRRHIERLDALIAVYPYGTVFDIHAVRQLCAEHSVFLIEDCAVAQGATIGKAPAGSFGDACIVSFGTGKIVDAGHGGAVLTNDRALSDAIGQLGAMLPAHTPEQGPVPERSVTALQYVVQPIFQRSKGSARPFQGPRSGRERKMPLPVRWWICASNHGSAGTAGG